LWLFLFFLKKLLKFNDFSLFFLYFWCHKVFNNVIKSSKMSEAGIKMEEKSQEITEIQPILGRADHRLDPKRRFTIPSDWYERMCRPAQVYVMPSLSRERCLDVFCPAEFDKRMEAFRNKALSDSGNSKFTSRIGELINCVTVDTQNRIRVKDSLLAYIGIKDEVVLIGTGYHFEVWSLANRPKLDGSEADILEMLAAEAQQLGF
jgi:MraZ protein